MDFGFSHHFTCEDDIIFIPQSRPWNAPEYDPSENLSCEFIPSRAKRMDIYSFGMICVWFLFAEYFAGRKPLPESALWALKTFLLDGKPRAARNILEDLKNEDNLLRVAHDILKSENTMNELEKGCLELLLDQTLALNEAKRANDIYALLAILNSHECVSFLT